MRLRALSLSIFAALAVSASAHDIWIEPSATIVRPADFLTLNLMLGNHGNNHRDFKLASKVPAGSQSMQIVDPSGKVFDLTPSLFDAGYTPQEGFWTARFSPTDKGLYTAVSQFDKVMSYAPVRDIKCAKAFFVVSGSLDRVEVSNPGFDRPVNAPFEIVPVSNPVTPMGPGTALKVKVLLQGQPAKNTKISFIPRGTELQGDQDPAFERMTDANGVASLNLKEANTYLIAAHLKDTAAKGVGYESINYSATLCIVVSGICPCCVD